MAEFSKFPAGTAEFLQGIAADNSKTWFDANRERYEAGYVEPARRFVEMMGERLKTVSPGVRYEPKVNGSIGRINRDIRFSRDKRPYKDHLDIWFWHGDRKGWDCPGFYLRITPATVFLGCGMHTLEGAQLDYYRQAVVAEKSGRALTSAIEKVKAAGPYEIGGATRKSVPRGFDASHERVGLLRHEGLYAGLELPGQEAATEGFADLAFIHFTQTWPIGKWLLDHVAR